MVSTIVSILNERSLSTMPWVERYGGLAIPYHKPRFLQDGAGNYVQAGEDVWPVSCDVTEAECSDDGVLKSLSPNSSVKSVAYWLDTAGLQFVRSEGPRQILKVFRFSVRLCVWLNGVKIEGAPGSCHFSDAYTPHLLANLSTLHITSAQVPVEFQGQIKSMKVTGASLLPKSPEILGTQFAFVKDGASRGFFISPYDYFAVQVTGEVGICQPATPTVAPNDDSCLPS